MPAREVTSISHSPGNDFVDISEDREARTAASTLNAALETKQSKKRAISISSSSRSPSPSHGARRFKGSQQVTASRTSVTGSASAAGNKNDNKLTKTAYVISSSSSSASLNADRNDSIGNTVPGATTTSTKPTLEGMRKAAMALPLGTGDGLSTHQILTLLHLLANQRHVRATNVFEEDGDLRPAYQYILEATEEQLSAAALPTSSPPKVDKPRRGEEDWTEKRKQYLEGLRGVKKGDGVIRKANAEKEKANAKQEKERAKAEREKAASKAQGRQKAATTEKVQSSTVGYQARRASVTQ